MTWTDEGKGFNYQWDGKSYHFDIAAGKAAETGAAAQPADGGNAVAAVGRTTGGGGGFGGRGGGAVIGGGGSLGGGGIARSQTGTVASPDGNFTAFTRDNNLWIRDADGGNETAITTDGSTKTA